MITTRWVKTTHKPNPNLKSIDVYLRNTHISADLYNDFFERIPYTSFTEDLYTVWVKDDSITSIQEIREDAEENNQPILTRDKALAVLRLAVTGIEGQQVG